MQGEKVGSAKNLVRLNQLYVEGLGEFEIWEGFSRDETHFKSS